MPPPLRQGPSAYTQGSRELHPGMTGFCYLRVSTDEQAEAGFGIDVQRDQCQRLWESDGLIVIPEHIFADEGVTGETLARPAFQRMLAAIPTYRPVALYLAS